MEEQLKTQNIQPEPSHTGSTAPVFRIYSQEEAYRHLTRERSQKEQELYLAVDEILFNVWDALSVSIDSSYREEYLPYLPHVFDLLISTTDGLDIFDYLVFIEETQYGADTSDLLTRQRAGRVVDILMKYRNE